MRIRYGWELALAKIATGEMDAYTFRKGIEVYASQIASELLKVQIDSGTSVICPRCGSPMALYSKVAKCLNANCRLAVFRSVAGKDLSDEQLKTLLSQGRTETIKGFQKKEGGTFDAAIVLNAEYKTEFISEARKQAKSGHKPRK